MKQEIRRSGGKHCPVEFDGRNAAVAREEATRKYKTLDRIRLVFLAASSRTRRRRELDPPTAISIFKPLVS